MSKRGKWTDLGKDKLQSSGLTSAEGDALGMYEVPSAMQVHPKLEARPALVIPYMGFDKQPMAAHPKWPNFFRVRYLDKPAKTFKDAAGEKESRYAQPPLSGVCAYFPISTDWLTVAKDTEQELLITEGELKASAACAAGFPTIGMGGVWNFRSSKEGTWFLPELEALKWVQRTVYIVFDSDYMEKPNICQAINALREELEERGARTLLVTLPDDKEAKKVGLDDYLLEHTPEELATLLGQGEPIGLAKALWKVNEEVLYVRDPGLVIIEESGQKLSVDMFKSHSDYATLSTTEIVVGAKGDLIRNKVSAAPVWIKWPLRRAVNKLTYAPGEGRITASGNYNQWAGWGTKPRKGSVDRFLRLSKYLFANTEPGILDYFYDWCAYPVQNPGYKMFVGVLIHGVVQGTGKTLLGYTLGEVYGQNFKEIKDEDLEETYWAENKQFILGDEVSGKDNRQYMNTLKRLITSRSIDINIKFVPQYTLPNCMNFMFTSQHGDSFFLEDRDRRYLVVEVQDEPLEEEFYKGYNKWLWEDGGAECVHQWLLDRKINPKFNPMAQAPRTSAKERMIAATKGDLAMWIYEMMQFPQQTLRIGKMVHTRDLFTSKELLAVYETSHPNSKVTVMGMGRALAAAGCAQVLGGQPVKGPDGMGRFFAVRNIKEWKKCTNKRTVEKHLTLQMIRSDDK